MTQENINAVNSFAERDSNDNVRIRYVAFCDILGFSKRILTQFDRTFELYKAFGKSMSSLTHVEAQATIYSDAILITAESLGSVLHAVQILWWEVLMHDFVIRGAITRGRYWEQREGNHLLVVSDALVRAVNLEKLVGVPAVVIADDIEIEDDYWLNRFATDQVATTLLHFRDRNIVNPFNRYGFASAGYNVNRMLAENPVHKDKYLWLIALYEAVSSGQDLIPPDVLARFVREGILVDKTKIAGQKEAPDNVDPS